MRRSRSVADDRACARCTSGRQVQTREACAVHSPVGTPVSGSVVYVYVYVYVYAPLVQTRGRR